MPSAFRVASLIVGLSTSIAVAQDWLPDGAVTGTVSSVGGGTVKLLDDKIAISASAARVSLLSGRTDLESLKPGTLLSITVRAIATGDSQQLVAQDIFELSNRVPFEAAVEGAVQAIDPKGTRITVLTVPATVGPATRFKNLSSASAIRSIAEIRPQSHVVVWLQKHGAGIAATMVYLESTVTFPDRRIFGKVLAVEPTRWRILDEGETELTVLIDKDTRFGDSVEKGDQICVLAITQLDRSLLAYFISKWPPKVQGSSRQ